MRYLRQIQKLSKKTTEGDEQLSLLAKLRLTQPEMQELYKVVHGSESALFVLEAETVEEDADLDEQPASDKKTPEYFIAAQPDRLKLGKLPEYIEKLTGLTNRKQELTSILNEAADPRALQMLQMNISKSDLEKKVMDIEEYDNLQMSIPDLESVIEELAQDLKKATELQTTVIKVKPLDAAVLDQIKVKALEARENFLINLTNFDDKRLAAKDDAQPAKVKNLAKTKISQIFLPIIIIVLTSGILGLLLGNFVIPVLSLFTSIFLGVLYWFALQIPAKPQLNPNLDLHQQLKSKASLDSAAESYEAEAFDFITRKKTELENIEASMQLENILDGKTYSQLNQLHQVSNEDLKLAKEKLTELGNLSSIDLLQVKRDLDILKIDLSRMQSDLAAEPETYDSLRHVDEIDLINNALSELDQIQEIVKQLTGFRMIRQLEFNFEGLSEQGEWVGIELTLKQLQQLSVLDQFEAWLDQNEETPIFLVNWDQHFSPKQQDKLSARVEKLKGLIAQMIFVDLV